MSLAVDHQNVLESSHTVILNNLNLVIKALEKVSLRISLLEIWSTISREMLRATFI
jgi:hypothetical protein